MLHIFKYTNTHQNNDLNFDLVYHNVESNDFVMEIIQAGRNIYVNSKEKLPPNTPSPRGHTIHINLFVDSYRNGNR